MEVGIASKTITVLRQAVQKQQQNDSDQQDSLAKFPLDSRERASSEHRCIGHDVDLVPAGRSGCSSASAFLMPSATAMVLAVPCFETRSPMLSCPLDLLIWVNRTVVSSISATSRR